MQKTLALILKKQNIGETDRILTIFSPTLGKKRVIVRSVRKPTSRLAGHLDTFMVSQLMLTEQNDLPKVTSAVLVESFEQMRSNLADVDRAFAISKIVERVILEDVPQQSIFQLTLDAFVRLNDSHRWPAVWLTFLGSLTDRLGLDVSNFRCTSCNQLPVGKSWWAVIDRALYCQNCPAPRNGDNIPLSLSAVKLLSLVTKKNYNLIQRVAIPENAALEAEELYLREITEWFNKPWLTYASLRRP